MRFIACGLNKHQPSGMKFMLPGIANSSIYFGHLPQSTALMACPWFFGYANDSAVLEIKKNIQILAKTSQLAGKHLSKPLKINDLNDKINFYSKTNDSAVLKRTH